MFELVGTRSGVRCAHERVHTASKVSSFYGFLQYFTDYFNEYFRKKVIKKPLINPTLKPRSLNVR